MLEMNYVLMSGVVFSALAILTLIYIIRLNRRPLVIMTDSEKEIFEKKLSSSSKTQARRRRKSRKKGLWKKRVCWILIIISLASAALGLWFPTTFWLASILPVIGLMIGYGQSRKWKSRHLSWSAGVYIFCWVSFLLLFLRFGGGL